MRSIWRGILAGAAAGAVLLPATTTAIRVDSGLGEVAVNPESGRAFVTCPLRNTVQVLAHCRG